MGLRPSAVLPSGQAEAVLYFVLFSRFMQLRTLQTQNPNYHPHSVSPCWASCPGLWPPEQCHPFENETRRLGWADMRGMRGDGGLPFHTWPSLPTHPLLESAFFLCGCWLQRGMLLWQRTHATHHTHTNSKRSVPDGLSLRRCCWRSWMWKPWPCWSCPRRLQTSGCEAWGRGHWPVGARRCGPPFGRLDSAL